MELETTEQANAAINRSLLQDGEVQAATRYDRAYRIKQCFRCYNMVTLEASAKLHIHFTVIAPASTTLNNALPRMSSAARCDQRYAKSITNFMLRTRLLGQFLGVEAEEVEPPKVDDA